MTTLTAIAALLQTVIALLTSSIGTPAQDQAVVLANQAVLIAQQAIVELQSPSTATISPLPAIIQSEPSIAPPPPAIQPEVVAPLNPSAPVAINQNLMTTIEIISPIPGKGLGRTYTAQAEIVDESNYIELGLICRDGQGNALKTPEVTIVATDTAQNKTLNGTGNVLPIGEKKVKTPFYPFHYEFKTVGDHTITFTCNGVSDSVTLTVGEPDPA